MSKGNRKRRRNKGVLPARERCIAHNRFGEPCGKYPIEGSVVCASHGGRAPQVQRKAAERIALAADPAAAKLLSLMQDPKVPPAVQLAATKDILDRAGIGTTKELEITLKPWQEDLEGLLYEAPDAFGDVIDVEVIEDNRVIAPSDWESREEPDSDIANHPPRYGRGNRLRGR